MKNLVKAILAVMKDVENIDKNMTVGEGKNSYSGVSDKDVKIAVGKSMQKHGLVMLPIEIDPTVKIERWEEDTYYNSQKSGVKVKQSVFTEVKTKYILMHESGESQIIEGYGHGVDSQDKSAGKATTYALKNTLLYSFLVPTGSIDDTDAKHSEDHQVPGDKSSKKPEDPKSNNDPKTIPVGIAPGLPKVVANAKDLVALNTIWNNNVALHENIEFLRLICLRRIDFANSTEDLSQIFADAQLLHADTDFVAQLTAKKKELPTANNKEKKTA